MEWRQTRPLSRAEAAPVDKQESEEGDGDEHECGAVGGGVVELLHLVEDGDGERASDAGDVAAEHEDDAELADGVGEGEDGGGEEAGAREREDDAAEDGERRGAESGGDVGEVVVDVREGEDERLHGEGKAVDDGADDESAEGEGERVADEVNERAAGGSGGAEPDEEIEAEDGGRKDERESDGGLRDAARRRCVAS